MYDVKPITTDKPTACGPACLNMLLEYYGVSVPLDTLIQECAVGVAGCSIATLSRVGKAHGLPDLAAWQMDAEDMLRQDRPAILWWKYTHYVVFCGLNDQGEPVICNPAMGRYPISREAFSRFFCGIALCNGEPVDFVPRAENNYKEGEAFLHGNATWIALRPITRGEKLSDGWNCKPYTIIDALNAQNKEE